MWKIVVVLMILFPLNALSQQEVKTQIQGNDSVRASSRESIHSLFTGIGYGSNMIYMGSTISQDQPYGYASLSYGFNDELFASVSAIHLSDSNPYLSFYIGSLYYSHTFNSWFDISSGIYRYQVESSLTDSLFNSFTYGDISLGFDWKLVYSTISLGGLFSDENQAYFQIKNSRFFKTNEFIKDKIYVSFDPYVNLLFGTLLKIETGTGSTFNISPPYRKWTSISQSGTNTSRTFGILEVDFGLPVAFNSDIITVEAEPAYVFPVYDDPDFPGLKGFVFLLSAFFKIF